MIFFIVFVFLRHAEETEGSGVIIWRIHHTGFKQRKFTQSREIFFFVFLFFTGKPVCFAHRYMVNLNFAEEGAQSDRLLHLCRKGVWKGIRHWILLSLATFDICKMGFSIRVHGEGHYSWGSGVGEATLFHIFLCSEPLKR